MSRSWQSWKISVSNDFRDVEVPKSIRVILKILTFISHAKNALESALRYPIHSILKEEIEFPWVVVIGQEIQLFRSNIDQFSEVGCFPVFSDVRVAVRCLAKLFMKCFGVLYRVPPKSPVRIS